MHALDLILTFLPLVIVVIAGIYAQSYVKSVVDFLSGNRAAGRFLLAIAGSELQAGAVVFVAIFEQISHSGFTLFWWNWIAAPVMLVVGISGFVRYRYRQTRALTLAQFFEIRYTKSFRLFTGVLGFVAGILNFGIIPAIGARCMVYFLELPETLSLAGHSFPTYIALMVVFLGMALFVALSGGVITVMLINCVEGIMSQLFYLVIIGALLWMFSWHQISSVLGDRPPGQSMLNPLDSSGTKDFNLWFVLMNLFVWIYGTMAWQNSSAYNSAALTPHEGRMGIILGGWREMGKIAVITLLGICAYTYLHHPDFATGAAQTMQQVRQISDPQAREQMESPIALANLLPLGVKGVFCAVLLMGIFGGDATHLHSWGSIFVQDIIVPRLKTPFSPRQHLWALRCAIVGVAVFAFFFGIFFTQTDYISMWWGVTQAIFTGGAGSAIVGGLYWKKGTSQGAWAALLTGSGLSVTGIVCQQIYGKHFPLNGTQISFFATLVAIAVYVAVSLLTSREDFNMDRMLHRGAFATGNPPLDDEAASAGPTSLWGKLVGFDENFTRGDKWIAGTLLGYSLMQFAILITGTIWNWITPLPLSAWSTFWNIVGVGAPVFFAFITGIWFTWGGIKDIGDLFARLRKEKVNHLDDGTVVGHQNLDEVATSAPDR